MNRKNTVIGHSVIGAMTLSAFAAFATDEARWVNSTDGEQLFFETANWQDGSGEALSDYPTNGEDLVLAAYPDNYAAQTITLSTNAAKTILFNGSGHKWTLGSISDSLPDGQVQRRTLGFRNTRAAGKSPVWMNVVLNDPDGFEGFWQPMNEPIQFTLLNSTMMNYLYPTTGRFRVTVGSGGSATVGTVSAGAIIDKTGAGTLAVADAGVRGDTSFSVSGGTVELREGPDDIPAGAVLHLDADATNTFTTYAGTDGRTYVKRWQDKNGHVVFADNYWDTYPQTAIGYTNAFISPVTANGHRLVDFGSCSGQITDLGPTNGILYVRSNKGEMSKVREVFYAGYITMNCSQYLVSNNSNTEFVHYGTLAASCSPAYVSNGDVIYNGRKRPATFTPNESGEPYTKMHVWSVGSLANMTVGCLGTDRGYKHSTGGCRLGEVIVYTNSLTHAQRLQIHRYLMRKWMGESAVGQTADQIVLEANAAVSVPEGETVSVGAVHLQATAATKLTKTGAGTLKISAIEPATTPIEVQGGAVAFGSAQAEFDTSKPAGTPTAWMDASVRSSFVISNNTAEVAQGATLTNYVTRWNDCRSGYKRYLRMPYAGSTYKVGASSEPKGLPYIREKHANGMDTLSFGVDNTDKTWMILDQHVVTREGFVIVRQVAEKTNIPTLNTSGMEFLRLYCGDYKYLNPSYASDNNCAGRWAKNGIVFDPTAANAYKDTTEYHLLNFATTGSNNIYYFCKDRNHDSGDGMSNFGRQDIAEIILYNRELTPAERYQTEAYLMKKWLGKDHPLAAAKSTSVSKLTYPAASDAVIDTDTSLAVATLSGGNGKLVKKGSGSATVASHSNVTDIEVEDGSLTAAFDSFESEALFHFDATDLSTLTYTVEEGVTNVTEWADVRKNGVKATAQTTSDNKYVQGLPRYKTYDLRGQKRAVMSFGRYKDSSHSPTDANNPSAGMLMSSKFTNVREAHTINRHHTYGEAMSVFTSRDQCHYLAGWPAVLWTTYSSSYVNNGYIARDGVVTNASVQISSAWWHLGFGPTGNTQIDSIAYDRACATGGSVVGEMIAFSRNLTDDERDYLNRKWAYKWFGEGSGAGRWACGISTLALGDGTTFANANAVDISCGRVTAEGSSRIDVDGLIVTDTLDMQDGEIGTLTVDGDLSLAAGTKVKLDAIVNEGFDSVSVGGALTVGGSMTVDLTTAVKKVFSYGEHTVITAAGGITGFETTKATVLLPSNVKRRVRVSRVGNRLVISVTPSGAMLIVR